MTFVVALIALLIERFFNWGHLRQWGWYASYRHIIEKKFAGQASAVVLAAAIVPLLVVVVIIGYALSGLPYSTFTFTLLFNLLVLLYCMGPQNLWEDSFACINAISQSDAGHASEKLKSMFGITDISNPQTLHKQFLINIFVEANKRVFAVVFWYAILGTVGAVLYRLLVLSSPAAAKDDTMPDVVQSAYKTETVMDWLPVRVFTFIFAIGGHFVSTFAVWRKDVLLGISSNETMLGDCGIAALGFDDQGKIAEDGSAERAAISLLDRVFVILLVIVAVLVIIL